MRTSSELKTWSDPFQFDDQIKLPKSSEVKMVNRMCCDLQEKLGIIELYTTKPVYSEHTIHSIGAGIHVVGSKTYST